MNMLLPQSQKLLHSNSGWTKSVSLWELHFLHVCLLPDYFWFPLTPKCIFRSIVRVYGVNGVLVKDRLPSHRQL